MGHPTDIFLSKPDDSFTCAICHEILKDASSFKECGHTFCDECISFVTNRLDPKCPTCRKLVNTGSNPNYLLRDIIDKLEVKCPEEVEESPAAKRLKTTGENNESNSENNDAVDYEYSGCCGWRGTVSGLKHHMTNECLLATVMCGVEGCTHTCQRRDMEAHRSSQQGMMQHMELKYENKLKAMEMKYESKYQMMNDRIIVLENRAKLCFNVQCTLPHREIKGRAMYCTRCGVANYCSRACQTSDWRNHQAYCDRYCRHARRVQDESRAERRSGNGAMLTQRRGGDGRRIFLNPLSNEYRNFLKDAICRTIRGHIENTGDSSAGVHVDEIITSLRGDGFSEEEVRNGLHVLQRDGFVYETIDGDHYNLAANGISIAPSSPRFAYGSGLNDAVIRILRDMGAQSEDGVHFSDILAELPATGGDIQYSAAEGESNDRNLSIALDQLLNEGHIYTTVNDDYYQWSEYPSHDTNATAFRS